MTKKSFFAILALFIANIMYGQTNSNDAISAYVNKFVPVSPNAASLGQYGAIPVGHYTGIPDVSIPVYEIEMDGKTFPITVNYHASGIKVAQEASTVGLGWTLNAGGCITREVRGGDDFGYVGNPSALNPMSVTCPGYYYCPLPPRIDSKHGNQIDFNQEDNSLYTRFHHNQADGEPDMFHFNFASFSGSMFFNKKDSTQYNTSSSAKPIIQKETEYMDVTFNITSIIPYGNGTWTIVDGNGFKYYFNTYEYSKVYASQSEVYSSSNEYAYLYSHSFNPRAFQPETVVSWYLDSIVSPNRRKISFIYEKDTVYSPTSVGEDKYRTLTNCTRQFCVRMIEGCSDPEDISDLHLSFYTYSYAKTEQVLLRRILFDGGEVNLNYSGRLDLESTNSNRQARKLLSVSISNNTEIIKSASLKHSYSGFTYRHASCRLMLDTLIINEGKYIFTYYNKNNLPDKNSSSSDYWDYYNGKQPPGDPRAFKLSPPYSSDLNHLFIPGLDKRSDENCMKAGILTGIQYPTGGKTLFEYEMNTFGNSFQQDCIKRISYCTQSFGGNQVNENIQLESICDAFTLSSAMNGKFTWDMGKKSYCSYHELTGYIDKQQPNGAYMSAAILFHQYAPPEGQTTDGGTGSVSLAPGTYRIRLQIRPKLGEYLIGITAAIDDERGQYIINSGGGLRIKKITDISDDAHSTQREFKYQLANGKSSGVLMIKPKHHKDYILHQLRYPLPDHRLGWYIYQGVLLNGHSSPYIPFGNSASGMNIGYSYVEEKMTDTAGNNGYITYSFYNCEDDDGLIYDNGYLRGYPFVPHLNNGSPLKISYFDKDMKPVRKQVFEYKNIKPETSVKGFKIFALPTDRLTECWLARFYDIYSERWVLNSKKDSLFFDNQAVSSMTIYGYNAVNRLANLEVIYAGENSTVRQTKYPVDFNSEPYLSMVNRHIVSPVVENIEHRNGSLLQKTITGYKNWGGNIFAPDTVKLQTGAQSVPESRIVYHKYDSHGNPLYITKDKVDKVVYLWGYNGKHPIAEIKNLTYDEVMAKLSLFSITESNFHTVPVAAIHAYLRNATFASALITTYTYKPLVGMLTAVDYRGVITYYVYDTFGRLKETYYNEDNDMNKRRSVQRYDYHYKTINN